MKYFYFIFLAFLLLSACSSTQTKPVECDSGVYANDSCCTYVCNKECDFGYKPDTCSCDCLDQPSYGLDNFNSDSSITPPSIPN